jgi:hypothetical protein
MHSLPPPPPPLASPTPQTLVGKNKKEIKQIKAINMINFDGSALLTINPERSRRIVFCCIL